MDTSREHLDPHCRDLASLATTLAGAPWRRLAVLGDSIAEGIGDPAEGYLDASWADQLVQALEMAGSPLAVLNTGARGLRAAEIRTQQLPQALAFDPDLAVVAAGANDMLRRSFDPDRVEPDVGGLIASLAGQGCLVVTFGLLDLSRTGFVPDGMRADLRGRILRLNALTRRLTELHGGVHVDLFAHPGVDDGFYSADMIHPNRRGHASIATAIVDALATRIATRSGR